MDWPLKAVTLGRPRPCKNLLEIKPTAAKIIREDEFLPCLVVLYSVFGLVEVIGQLKCAIRLLDYEHTPHYCDDPESIPTFSSIQDSIEVLLRMMTFI